MRHRGQWILIEGPFRKVTDANSDEITLFCPNFYDLGTSGLLRGKHQYRLSTAELRTVCEKYLSQNEGVSPSGSLGEAPWAEPSKADFVEALAIIQNKIIAGQIQKAVPVVFARSANTPSPRDRAQLILNLLNAPETLYVYGFWDGSEGVLGATPETLFEFAKGRLRTMALAGTCPKEDASARESLLQDPKEMQEHRLVVEDISAVLAPYGKVQSDGPHILELPTLYHLQTHIELQCTETPSFTALIAKLHPTPALGVAPRAYGYQWMRDLPGQAGRARYGAPFAMLSAEEALCLVGIRNLQWNEKTSMIGSGCGVVAASELEREWRELLQKRTSVRKILGLNL